MREEPELLNKPLSHSEVSAPPIPGRVSKPRFDFSTPPKLLNRPLPAESDDDARHGGD
jgi:hypothetical protein